MRAALLVLGLGGCGEMLAAFQEGFEGGGASPEAPAPGGEPPGVEPTRLVPLDGSAAALPAAPSRPDAREWLAVNGVCTLREDALVVGEDALTVAPPDLARAWSVLARSPAGPERAADRVLGTCAFIRAASWPEAERRAFLEQTALARDPLEALPPRPLVALIDWIGVMTHPDPTAALAAHLSVLTGDEVADWLIAADMVDPRGGEWAVDRARLAALPDPVKEAIVARLEAGPVGPRAQVVRAIEASR